MTRPIKARIMKLLVLEESEDVVEGIPDHSPHNNLGDIFSYIDQGTRFSFLKLSLLVDTFISSFTLIFLTISTRVSIIVPSTQAHSSNFLLDTGRSESPTIKAMIIPAIVVACSGVIVSIWLPMATKNAVKVAAMTR